MLYSHMQHHNDTIIKTQEDFFNKIFTSHFIARVRKGLLKVCVWEGAGDRTETVIFWLPTLMAVNVVSFSFSWCSTGGPGVHSAGCWLSLLHLIRNFSGPQTPSGFPRAPPLGRVWLFLSRLVYNSHSNCNSNWLLSWLSNIIVQSPLDRPLDLPLDRQLDLWNGMIDRHPAEITVMQFTGHSLPVHQSMSVPWEFF